MKIVVLKFGGTSVGTIQKIKNVANIIGNFKRAIIWGGAKRYNIELVYEK